MTLVEGALYARLMRTMAADTLIIPTAIPWTRLKRKELEECLYWLLDALGGKDLQWRLGGTGDGAPDQGRDLEAVFYTEDPDGTLIPKKWWVEAKGRGKTVGFAEIASHIDVAALEKDLDRLILATNRTFSNDAQDAVRKWQDSHPRPIVRLWDCNELERLLSKHPQVVVRFWAEALSPQGQLEVVRSRFQNYAAYAGRPLLKLLWKQQADLTWEPEARLAVIVSEAANGSFSSRPWSPVLGDQELINVLGGGLLNMIAFGHRADGAGTEQSPYFNGLAYLLLAVLDRLGEKVAYEILTKVWDHAEWGAGIPSRAREYLLGLVLHPLHLQLRDVCITHCGRVSMDRIELTEKEAERYWSRLGPPSASSDSDEEGHPPLLAIEDPNRPCRAGFHLDHPSCPFVSMTEEEFALPQLLDTLTTMKRMIDAREGRLAPVSSKAMPPGGKINKARPRRRRPRR